MKRKFHARFLGGRGRANRLRLPSVQSAAQRILVIDSSKIGREALYVFCPLTDCDLVLTDSGIKPEHLRQLRKRVPVQIAD